MGPFDLFEKDEDEDRTERGFDPLRSLKVTITPPAPVDAPDEPLAVPEVTPEINELRYLFDKSQNEIAAPIQAGRTTPDNTAKANDLAKKSGLPPAVVERNMEIVQKKVEEDKLRKALVESNILKKFAERDPRNLSLAADDLQHIGEVEKQWKRFRGTAIDVSMNINDVINALTPSLGNILFGTKGKGLADDITDFSNAIGELVGLRAPGDVKTSEAARPEIPPGTTFDDVLEEGMSKYLPFLKDTIVTMIPETVLAMSSLPIAIVAIVGRLANDRAKNNKTGEATLRDMLTVLPSSVVVAFLDRIGGRSFLGLDGILKATTVKGGVKAVGVKALGSAGKELTTEGVQESLEYTTGTLGTERGFDLQEMLLAGLGGAAAGGPIGGGIRTLTAGAEATVQVVRAKKRTKALKDMNNADSKLRERDPGAYGELQGLAMAEAGIEDVSITEEGARILNQEAADTIPEDELTEAAVEGGTVIMTPEKFWALPKETIDKVASHVSFNSSVLSENEAIEAEELSKKLTEEDGEAMTRQLVEEQQEGALVAEIQNRLAETGGALSSPGDARAAAEQMAAVFSTMARRAGTDVKEIVDQFLPTITKIEAPSTFVPQPPSPTRQAVADTGAALRAAKKAEGEVRDRTQDDIAAARDAGATDEELAALFEEQEAAKSATAIADTAYEAALAASSATGGAAVVLDDTLEQAGTFKPVGSSILPKIADPSPDVLAEAKPDTARSGAAVNARLPIIIPESERVAESPYVVGHPDGRSWTELTEDELSVKGTGVTLTQADLDGIMEGVLPDVSKAARDAVESTGASFQLTPAQLDAALKLDLRAQLWYELSGETFKTGMPSLTFDQHFMFLDLIGATSARARPFDNLARSLAVLSQFLRGVPIDTDLSVPTAVSKALGRGGQDVTNLSGNKTGQFSNTMALTGGMETSYPIPVNDVWVGVMFGITDKQLTSNQSLHEVMALYQIRLAELVRAKGNSGTTVPHQPWHVQARGWVQLRSEDAGIDTATAEKVEGNDYAAEWPRIIKLLRDAGVPGISKDGVLSEQALMSPLFIDAIRPTVKGWRDAPKATVEVGTLLTTKGRHAADLVEAGLAVGDTLTESKYYDAILSTLSKMSLKKFKQGSMLPVLRSIAGSTFNITRIQTGTKARPFDVAGWFEGRLSPNIRIPLQALSTENFLADPETGELRWSEISVFNAVVGKALNQAAMATSEVLPVNAAEPARDGYISGTSVFVQDNSGLTPEQLKTFANALPEGFGLSSYTLPGGVVIDINPKYDPATDSLVGIEGADLEPAIDALGLPDGVASLLDHDFKSVYDEASEYDVIIEQFIKSVKAKATEQLMAVEKTVIRKVKEKDKDGKTITKEVEEVIRLDPAVAAAIADAASPVASVAKRKIPSSIRGRVSTVAKTLEGRLSDFATGQQGYTDLAQDLETNLEKDFGRAAKRIEKAGGTAPALQVDDVILQQRIDQDVPPARGDILTDLNNVRIRLFEAEDMSTFLHESGHLYFEMLGSLAERPGADPKLVEDFKTVLDWLGANNKSEITTAQHEKWAQSYEEYLREGKSPSVRLTEAFSKFTAWLTTLYRRLRVAGSLPDAALTDEIRDVFDRLLATEEQIEEAQRVSAMLPVFDSAASGELTETEYNAYGNAVERASNAAHAELAVRAFNDVRRETQAWWKAQLNAEIDVLLKRLDTDLVWQARHLLQHGNLPSGDALPDSRVSMKMDRQGIRDMGFDLKELPGGNSMFRVKGGVPPDTVAHEICFQSGDEMLQALMNLPKNADGKFLTARQFATQQAEARLKEEHGDIMNDGTLHEEALLRVHSEEQSRVLAFELKQLSKMSGGSKAASNRVMKEAARRILAGKNIDAILKYKRFLAAEHRASNKAYAELAEGNTKEAHAAKQQQLLNFHLYRQARQMAAQADTVSKRMGKWKRQKMSPTSTNPEFIEQAKMMLSGVNFGKRLTEKRIQTLTQKAFDNWAEQQTKTYGAQFHVPAELDAAFTKDHYLDMSMDELMGLHDAVKSVLEQGRRYNKALNAQFNQKVDRIAQSIKENATKQIKEPREQKIRSKLRGGGRLFAAEHRKMESIAIELDGGVVGGPVWTEVFLRVKRANDKYIDRGMQSGHAMDAILNKYTKKERIAFYIGRKHIPEIGESLSLSARLSFALNMGNAGNVAALQTEYTDEQINAVLRTLTDKDWDVVEDTWSNVNTFWEDQLDEDGNVISAGLAALEERTTGVKPTEVKATPFTTPSGREVTGGYYPLQGDPNLSEESYDDYVDSQSLGSFMTGGHAKKSTKSGSTIERRGFGKDRKIWLDLRVVFEHLDGVIKDIEMREAVSEVQRIIKHKSFSDAVTSAKGKEFQMIVKRWLDNVIGNDRQPVTTMEKIATYARIGASLAEMGFSLRTMIQQPMGFTQSIVILGEKYAVLGAAQYISERGEAVKKIMEASPFMRNRAATFNRDVRDAERALGVKGLKSDLASASFWGIQKLDMAVSIPTWLGAYEKSLDEQAASGETVDMQLAVDKADSAVERSQGSGLPRSMADIQQGSGWKKMFTMFYSFFSAYYNLQTDSWKQTSFKNPAQALKWAKNQVYITLIPSLVIDYFFNGGPEEEDELWWEWVGKSVLGFMAGGIVGVRDFVTSMTSGYAYQLTPASNMLKNTGRAVRQLAKWEFDARFWRALAMAVGYTTHFPGARQLERGIRTIDADEFRELDDFESWWRLLIQGPSGMA